MIDIYHEDCVLKKCDDRKESLYQEYIDIAKKNFYLKCNDYLKEC